MNRPRWILMLIVFLCLLAVVATGCKSKSKKGPGAPPPDWEIWSDPGAPAALDTSDAQGDHAVGGASADLSLVQGTYDDNYVYAYVDVYSTSGLDESGSTAYYLILDANNSGGSTVDAGDYQLLWNSNLGLRAYDHSANQVSIGVQFQRYANDGIVFAIPRGLVNQTAFGVSANTYYLVGSNLELADVIPDQPQEWTTFSF